MIVVFIRNFSLLFQTNRDLLRSIDRGEASYGESYDFDLLLILWSYTIFVCKRYL